jgi:hypothetical protein
MMVSSVALKDCFSSHMALQLFEIILHESFLSTKALAAFIFRLYLLVRGFQMSSVGWSALPCLISFQTSFYLSYWKNLLRQIFSDQTEMVNADHQENSSGRQMDCFRYLTTFGMCSSPGCPLWITSAMHMSVVHPLVGDLTVVAVL